MVKKAWTEIDVCRRRCKFVPGPSEVEIGFLARKALGTNGSGWQSTRGGYDPRAAFEFLGNALLWFCSMLGSSFINCTLHLDQTTASTLQLSDGPHASRPRALLNRLLLDDSPIRILALSTPRFWIVFVHACMHAGVPGSKASLFAAASWSSASTPSPSSWADTCANVLNDSHIDAERELLDRAPGSVVICAESSPFAASCIEIDLRSLRPFYLRSHGALYTGHCILVSDTLCDSGRSIRVLFGIPFCPSTLVFSIELGGLLAVGQVTRHDYDQLHSQPARVPLFASVAPAGNFGASIWF
ncbi:hypothetical protein NM208_g10412 [Fusarium decemcellulare]|uniref:Uncharacterized protein n=1 Tax=Fusarium decemcellulare TaxID=57161 RepID=A0ACC1RY29_9HYPO|nr:hypothetical protein NM208_g10412 [Fusarium decemcellulare]